MIWPWKKQVRFHPININCYISTSLDFVIPRAKSSEKITSSPAEVFLGKCVQKFAAYFLSTFFKNIYVGLLLKVKEDSIKIILSSRKSNTTLNKLNIFKIIGADALKTFNK